MGLAIGKVVDRLLEKAFKALDLELQQAALVQVAGAVDAHMAAGPGQVIRLVIFQAVGVDHGVGLAHDGIPLHQGIQVGPARDAVALQEHRGFAPLLRAQGFR